MTADVTDADRERAAEVWDRAVFSGYALAALEVIAAALAEERAAARAPFLELAADFDDGSEWGSALIAGYEIRRRLLRAAEDGPA